MVRGISKRGAMELSMNTIVIVVIGITLLVLGLVFVRGIFTKLGGLGTQAFQSAEQELKQIQAGDSKINFLASIDVKKGGTSNPTLSVCNIDDSLTGAPSVKLTATNFPANKGISVKIPDTRTTLEADGETTISSRDVGTIPYQKCRPFPMLVSAKPNAAADLDNPPFLTITVLDGTDIYDSTGTVIAIT